SFYKLLIMHFSLASRFGQLCRTINWFYTQEGIPHRSNRCGEAWDRYYQRMHDKSEDQRDR
ncbi:hypothetical protein ABZP36_028385, partial [Zizania latifolia]